LSKSVRELLQEFDQQAIVEGDFSLHILRMVIDPDGEVEQSGNAQVVFKVEFDHEDGECLLHFIESSLNKVTVDGFKTLISPDVLDYEVCAAQEKVVDGSCLRYATPLIGFGENVEQKCFFAICQV
jgi:hypothetical protein